MHNAYRMKRSLLAAVLLAACTQPRFEHHPSGSTDWMTGSFLREHAQCRTVRPDGQPDAEAPCLVYYLPPMPDAPPQTALGRHFVQIEFSDRREVQIPLRVNRRNQLSFPTGGDSSIRPQGNGWTRFRLAGEDGAHTVFDSDTQILDYLNRNR